MSDFLMVIMPSGIARGRVRTTATATTVVRFVDDLRVVEVNNVIKSSRVFCDV